MSAAPPRPFVVGVSRSGTTLLRLMLDAHPDLAIPPETHFLPNVAAAATTADPRAACLRAMLAARTWPDFHLDAETLRARLAALDPFTPGGAVEAFYRLYAARFGKPRWGDKTPGYLARLAPIHELIPAARFVHLIRDGRDVALSIHGLWFGPASIAEAAGWWVERIAAGRDQARRLPAGHYLEVRYEDLVRQPEPALRRIAAFIDLPWHPAMLAYHTHAADRIAELGEVAAPGQGKGGDRIAPAARRALFAHATRPPDPGRIGRWRTEMAPADRAHFAAVAGDLLRELGYDDG